MLHVQGHQLHAGLTAARFAGDKKPRVGGRGQAQFKLVHAREHGQRVLSRAAIDGVLAALAVEHLVRVAALEQVSRVGAKDLAQCVDRQAQRGPLRESQGLHIHHGAGHASVFMRALQAQHLGDAGDAEHLKLAARAKQHQGVGARATVHKVAPAQPVQQVVARRAKQPVRAQAAQARRDGQRFQSDVCVAGAQQLKLPQARDRMRVLARRKISSHRAQACNGLDRQAGRRGPEHRRVLAFAAVDHIVAAQAVDQVVAGRAGERITQPRANDGARRNRVLKLGAEGKAVVAVVVLAACGVHLHVNMACAHRQRPCAVFAGLAPQQQRALGVEQLNAKVPRPAAVGGAVKGQLELAAASQLQLVKVGVAAAGQLAGEGQVLGDDIGAGQLVIGLALARLGLGPAAHAERVAARGRAPLAATHHHGVNPCGRRVDAQAQVARALAREQHLALVIEHAEVQALQERGGWRVKAQIQGGRRRGLQRKQVFVLAAGDLAADGLAVQQGVGRAVVGFLLQRLALGVQAGFQGVTALVVQPAAAADSHKIIPGLAQSHAESVVRAGGQGAHDAALSIQNIDLKGV